MRGFQLTVPEAGSTISGKVWWWFFLSGFTLLTGCQSREFKPSIKFIDLYVELKVASVAYGNELEKVNEVRRVILAKHQQTPAAFHEQYVQLVAHPAAWRKFQEQVIYRVENFKSTHPKKGTVASQKSLDTTTVQNKSKN